MFYYKSSSCPRKDIKFSKCSFPHKNENVTESIFGAKKSSFFVRQLKTKFFFAAKKRRRRKKTFSEELKLDLDESEMIKFLMKWRLVTFLELLHFRNDDGSSGRALE